MRTLMRLFGLLIVMAVAGIGTIVAAGLYMGERSEHAARSFCASVPDHTTVSEIRQLAEEVDARLQLDSEDAGSRSIAVVFLGWMFNAWRCEVSIDGHGHVVRRRVIEAADP